MASSMTFILESNPSVAYPISCIASYCQPYNVFGGCYGKGDMKIECTLDGDCPCHEFAVRTRGTVTIIQSDGLAIQMFVEFHSVTMAARPQSPIIFDVGFTILYRQEQPIVEILPSSPSYTTLHSINAIRSIYHLPPLPIDTPVSPYPISTDRAAQPSSPPVDVPATSPPPRVRSLPARRRNFQILIEN